MRSPPAAAVDDPDNIFNKIIQGKIPSYKARSRCLRPAALARARQLTPAARPPFAQLFETEHALAFLDAFPMAKGHALLIPKAPGCVSVLDMPADVAANVLKELPRLARAVQAATGCDGVNVVTNALPAAGQVVFHAHFHVIPRFEGDGVVRLGAHGASSKMIDPEDAKAIGDAIRAAL